MYVYIALSSSSRVLCSSAYFNHICVSNYTKYCVAFFSLLTEIYRLKIDNELSRGYPNYLSLIYIQDTIAQYGKFTLNYVSSEFYECV